MKPCLSCKSTDVGFNEVSDGGMPGSQCAEVQVLCKSCGMAGPFVDCWNEYAYREAEQAWDKMIARPLIFRCLRFISK